MKFARNVFLGAGIYGLAVLIPGPFTEGRFNLSFPPAITHPEFYYGFFGSALVWQLVFLLIARDPVRYRPLIGLAVLEKAAFFVPCLALFLAGRLAADGIFWGAMIDGLLMLLFAVAWAKTRTRP